MTLECLLIFWVRERNCITVIVQMSCSWATSATYLPSFLCEAIYSEKCCQNRRNGVFTICQCVVIHDQILFQRLADFFLFATAPSCQSSFLRGKNSFSVVTFSPFHLSLSSYKYSREQWYVEFCFRSFDKLYIHKRRVHQRLLWWHGSFTLSTNW
jgi:hypothetical protein